MGSLQWEGFPLPPTLDLSSIYTLQCPCVPWEMTQGRCITYVIGVLCLPDTHQLFSLYNHSMQGEVTILASLGCPMEPLL